MCKFLKNSSNRGAYNEYNVIYVTQNFQVYHFSFEKA